MNLHQSIRLVLEDKVPVGTKKPPKGESFKPRRPFHIHGVGVVDGEEQASKIQKLFPGVKVTQLFKDTQ